MISTWKILFVKIYPKDTQTQCSCRSCKCLFTEERSYRTPIMCNIDKTEYLTNFYHPFLLYGTVFLLSTNVSTHSYLENSLWDIKGNLWVPFRSLLVNRNTINMKRNPRIQGKYFTCKTGKNEEWTVLKSISH